MPKQVYIYGDVLLKATMPDEGYHYHFHYDEVLQRYPERRTQVVNRSKMGATISKGESLVQHDLNRGLEADYALVAYGGNDSDYDWAAIDRRPGGEPSSPDGAACLSGEAPPHGDHAAGEGHPAGAHEPTTH